MKKTIFLLTLLFSFSLVAQRSLRVFNLNVKRGYESSVVETFSDFSSGEKWKSGGVMLQAVRFKNGVTHRIVVWGDPENWGTERERTDDEWDLYLERMNNFTYPNTADSAMGSILAFTEGDWKKNLSARVYDDKVHEPDKFKKDITVIMISHRLELIKKFDKILFIDNGKIQGFEKYNVLYKRNPKFRALASNRFKELFNQE